MNLFYYKKSVLRRKEIPLDFLGDFNYSSLDRKKRRPSMANELECPICEASVPLEGDEKASDLIMCSYCKSTFKLLRTKEGWILSEDFEE
jgi:hypothetical protein